MKCPECQLKLDSNDLIAWCEKGRVCSLEEATEELLAQGRERFDRDGEMDTLELIEAATGPFIFGDLGTL